MRRRRQSDRLSLSCFLPPRPSKNHPGFLRAGASHEARDDIEADCRGQVKGLCMPCTATAPALPWLPPSGGSSSRSPQPPIQVFLHEVVIGQVWIAGEHAVDLICLTGAQVLVWI